MTDTTSDAMLAEGVAKLQLYMKRLGNIANSMNEAMSQGGSHTINVTPEMHADIIGAIGHVALSARAAARPAGGDREAIINRIASMRQHQIDPEERDLLLTDILALITRPSGAGDAYEHCAAIAVNERQNSNQAHQAGDQARYAEIGFEIACQQIADAIRESAPAGAGEVPKTIFLQGWMNDEFEAGKRTPICASAASAGEVVACDQCQDHTYCREGEFCHFDPLLRRAPSGNGDYFCDDCGAWTQRAPSDIRAEKWAAVLHSLVNTPAPSGRDPATIEACDSVIEMLKESGHCGESTSEAIARRRRDATLEAAQKAIRALAAPKPQGDAAAMMTEER